MARPSHANRRLAASVALCAALLVCVASAADRRAVSRGGGDGEYTHTADGQPIGTCRTKSDARCYVSCLFGKDEQRITFVVERLEFLSDESDPSGLEGVRATLADSNGMRYSAMNYRATTWGPVPINLNTCRRSGSALRDKGKFLNSLDMIVTQPLLPGNAVSALNFVGPCTRPDSTECFIHCRLPDRSEHSLIILAYGHYRQSVKVKDATSKAESWWPRATIENNCHQSPEVKNVAEAEKEVPKGGETGNIWDVRFEGRENERPHVVKRGVPLGGGKMIKLGNALAAIAAGAPLAGVDTQRLTETPYVLPEFRIEINPFTGAVFVNMPLSAQWGSDRSPPDAVTYVQQMFNRRGTLPNSVFDTAGPLAVRFRKVCKWTSEAYLYAVAPVMADGGSTGADLVPGQFRIVIAPECEYNYYPHYYSRIVKHGDLVPFAKEDDPTTSVLSTGSKWHIPSSDPHGAMAQQMADACKDAVYDFLTIEGQGRLPSWAAVTMDDPLKAFSGSCRGPAYMAGEIYWGRSKRGAEHQKEARMSTAPDTFLGTPNGWWMDGDSSYSFVRSDKLYLGWEVMGVLKNIMASMHIRVSELQVNLLATSVTLDPRHHIPKLSSKLVYDETRDTVDAGLMRSENAVPFPFYNGCLVRVVVPVAPRRQLRGAQDAAADRGHPPTPDKPPKYSKKDPAGDGHN